MIEKKRLQSSTEVCTDQISDLLSPEPILDTHKTILNSEPKMSPWFVEGGEGMSHVRFGEEQVTASRHIELQYEDIVFIFFLGILTSIKLKHVLHGKYVVGHKL